MTQKGSRIFLMEIIIAILIFSLVGAYCLRIFTQTRIHTEQTADLTVATSISSSMCNILLAEDSRENAVQKLRKIYPLASIDTVNDDNIKNDGEMYFYLSKDGTSCSMIDATYMTVIENDTIYNKAGLCTFDVSVYKANHTENIRQKKEQPIYTVNLEVFYEK